MLQTPILLSIETSGPICSVALDMDGTTIIEERCEENVHDESLAEMSRTILNKCGLSPANLDAVCVSAGPGSFTGLRIGGSFAMALCYGNSPKLIAVPTISAVARWVVEHHLTLPSEFAIVLPSHGTKFYHQEFSGKGMPISPVTLSDSIENQLHFECYYMIESRSRVELHIPPLLTIPLSARLTLDLGREYFQLSKFTDATKFVPDYHQDFQVKP